MDKVTQRLGIVSVIDPDNYAAGTFSGDVVDMSKVHEALFLVAAGDIGDGNGTIDYKVKGCATSNGSFVALTGKAITQLTIAGSDSNKQAAIEVTAEDARLQGYRYVQDELIVTGTANSDVTAIALATRARYGPASDNDLASVDELV